MSRYRTVVRITQYSDSMNLVWCRMIGWKLEPFWYPAEPFHDLVTRQDLLTVSHRNPLRFICDANIYADDIGDLNIENVKVAEPPPEEWL